jgi:hypothetical protein
MCMLYGLSLGSTLVEPMRPMEISRA